ACTQDGLYPALVGNSDQASVLVTSPIIVGDDPKIADESPGDLFDMAEIDEMLALRIQTLTAEEKAEVRATDPRARQLLERTESLSEGQRLHLHGRTTLSEPVLDSTSFSEFGATEATFGKRYRPGD